METQVRTPQMVFMQPQRLLVPLFQRPYVWNQENQWEPLWEDVVRGAERLLKHPQAKRQPHFLGAVVLQQSANAIGLLQSRTIIDGQQRLTTLQLLLDALHAELLTAGASAAAARIEALVTNAAPFCTSPEDRFKVWPTNRDRAAFNAVMGATPPIRYDAIGYARERMVEAHRFFSEQARDWLKATGTNTCEERAAAVELMVRELLPMVVIDLAADENAQEIFETLNARGAPLTAADLIKNFIFQRLSETGTNVEMAYDNHWKEFETGFWEAEVSVGRMRYPRSAIFLNHWLIARTGEEVVAREVFDRFKRFADEAGMDMSRLLVQLHNASRLYRRLVEDAIPQPGSIDRLGLFGYRTGALESEIVKPLLLCLLDPEAVPIPENQVTKALECVESWMVRRMLVRATTKNYNQVIAELVALILRAGRTDAGDVVEKYLQGQTGDSRYWPDDSEVRRELKPLPIYRRISRGRLRMVLEALEDHLRGWKDGKSGLGGERVARGKFTIEHILPRKWATNWPLPIGLSDLERDRWVDTIGNLTLLTMPLNSKVSNGPWLGSEGKREGVAESDVLVINREILKQTEAAWTDESIGVRAEALCEMIVHIWPVPEGHKANSMVSVPRRRKKVHLTDLMAAGVLAPGTVLHPRRKAFASRTATLLGDGQVEVDGRAYARVSDAAALITGKTTNGWDFFLVDPATKQSLRKLRAEYVSEMAVDAEDDDADGSEEED